jgi:hypothetical protein
VIQEFAEVSVAHMIVDGSVYQILLTITLLNEAHVSSYSQQRIHLNAATQLEYIINDRDVIAVRVDHVGLPLLTEANS